MPVSTREAILRGMLTLVVGTNRPGSSSRKVSREIERIYAGLDVPVHVLDLQDLPAEVFHPSSYAAKPPSFTPFAEAVLHAEGLIVVSPEYNGGMPGVLKYFIDLLKFPESFDHRPVCFVGVSSGIWGALRPIEQLQLIFGYRNAFCYPDRVFIPNVTKVLGLDGTLQDAKIHERLVFQATGFVEFVERLQGVKLRRS